MKVSDLYLVDVVDSADIWVIEFCCSLGFPHETFLRVLVSKRLG